MTVQELISHLKEGKKVYHSHHKSDFCITNDDVFYRGNWYDLDEGVDFWKLTILLDEIGDRVVVKEPKPDISVVPFSQRGTPDWRPCIGQDYLFKQFTVYAKPERVKDVEDKLKELL